MLLTIHKKKEEKKTNTNDFLRAFLFIHITCALIHEKSKAFYGTYNILCRILHFCAYWNRFWGSWKLLQWHFSFFLKGKRTFLLLWKKFFFFVNVGNFSWDFSVRESESEICKGKKIILKLQGRVGIWIWFLPCLSNVEN